MAALLPRAIHPATTPTWPSRSTSLPMSLRQESCRASAADNKSPDYLPESLSESLHVLPHTSTGWSKVIGDVKREYLNRRYRPCATRCSEILDTIKDFLPGDACSRFATTFTITHFTPSSSP
ncbi:hypothetical protein NM208_g16375 [Fusarium decemcellulare]|uniref:Uncharacterized protein n=1 Tax=Fusarium decemcellulare TaxID=57161 RepID=A0ACC1RBL8_9HYPO|nr:hypothetical protein NM208_g16375 [Fusarium decemcellulare]